MEACVKYDLIDLPILSAAARFTSGLCTVKYTYSATVGYFDWLGIADRLGRLVAVVAYLGGSRIVHP